MTQPDTHHYERSWRNADPGTITRADWNRVHIPIIDPAATHTFNRDAPFAKLVIDADAILASKLYAHPGPRRRP